MGHVAEAEENFSEAAVCFQTKLDLAQAIGYRVSSGASSTHLAYIALQQQSFDVARLYLCEALRTVFDAGYLWQSTIPLACAARILAQQDQWLRSVEILGAIDEHLTSFHLVNQIAHALRIVSKLSAFFILAARPAAKTVDASGAKRHTLETFNQSICVASYTETTYHRLNRPHSTNTLLHAR